MDEEVVRSYLKAGRIARIVREEAAKKVKPGLSIRELCEWIERRIVELGGKPAFPCNIGIDNIAAHYTPTLDDNSLVPADSVVKIDLGVHVDGYIADTAVTVDLSGKYEGLLTAVREALENALNNVKPGTRFAEISRIIEETIKRKGFKPIANLGGHSLARYRIHAGDNIPNAYDPFIRGKFKCGQAYAIEPFGTNGVGIADETDKITIYSIARLKLKRRISQQAKNILNIAYERFKTLPFCERWLADASNDITTLRHSLRKLSRMGFLTSYPVLVERGGGVVAQFEHTILITGKCEVIVTTT